MSNFKHLNSSLKPREKMKMYGIETLSDAEVLSIFLQSGNKKESVISLSQKLIEKYNGLNGVINTDYNDLIKNEGVGEVKALKIKAMKHLIYNLKDVKMEEKITIKGPDDVFINVKEICEKKQEHLVLFCIDNKSRLILKKTIFVGTIDEISIHPREIFNEALKSLCHCIILVHNHPSGDVTPSEADLISTKKLVEISKLVGVQFLDHLIVGNNEYLSMREKTNNIFL